MPTAFLALPHGMLRALKWAPLQLQKRGTTHTVHAGRVKKRSSTNMRPVGKRNFDGGLVDNNDVNANRHYDIGSILKLESEIAFTQDALSTIVVMFDSLHHAYAGSKYEMDMSRCETRLSAKEKELLSAYDDLSHQVIHLERQVKMLESKLADLKSDAGQQDTVSPLSPYEDLESPFNFQTEQKQQTQLQLIDPLSSLNECVDDTTTTTPCAFYQGQPAVPFVDTAPPLLTVAPPPMAPLPLYDTETLLLMEMLYQDTSTWLSSQ